jgi:hypothetical protein
MVESLPRQGILFKTRFIRPIELSFQSFKNLLILVIYYELVA